jgi:hypothetical protein
LNLLFRCEGLDKWCGQSGRQLHQVVLQQQDQPFSKE